MSVSAGAPWEYQAIKFFGLSLSGIRTAVSMPELDLSFDVAQGFPYLLGLKKYFITHGHLDHAAGIPYIISQKAMTNQAPAEFYMPPSLVDPLDQIMKLWQKIEKHEYNYRFIPVQADDKIELKGAYFVRAFPTLHRVESFGYTVFETHKKLKKEFLHYNQDEIVELRRQHIPIQEKLEVPIVSFTGDTQIEFLDLAPQVKKSKILFLETTYLDHRRSIQQARDWGHTHLDELIPRLPEIEAEKIVLIHISSRYSTKESEQILLEKIPKEYHERFVIFPGR